MTSISKSIVLLNPMTRNESTNGVEYPLTPEEWLLWLETNLNIDKEQGREMVEKLTFPLDVLVDIWENEFSVELGYSPSFIPALIRNKNGFVKWVYCDCPEPNWSNSDST